MNFFATRSVEVIIMINSSIPLRMIVFKTRNEWTMICLETYIAVQASVWEDLETKMRDATQIYFQSFTKEAIERGEYIRKAPIGYRLLWSFRSTFLGLTRLISGPLRATYDPLHERLQFA
jgi:hypothetical protein